MKIYRPDYFDAFRCIAGDCPDSCCKEWAVQVDLEAAAYYRSLPGALGDRLREVLLDKDGETVMSIEDGRCPMWRADGLCRIQAELGEAALCKTCREFPRLTHDYGDFVELGLELSCPEAANYILNASDAPFVYAQEAGGEGEYDAEAMEVLLTSRSRALALLSDGNRSIGVRLALLLLYGCEVQSALDGGELLPFDVEAALSDLKQMELPRKTENFEDFFLGLEILSREWETLLRTPVPGPWDPHTPALARYLVNRYWLQAVSDYDLYSRVKLVIITCLLVRNLGGNIFRTAQLWSKEIENDADNVDAILDAAYGVSAFTDDKLLRQLLEDELGGSL